ncbi:hypothetical protein E2C01_097972 [Portunus trituberculatus]|uniref:Uncharacterized protein n=1 Tax=Portunus trituberculatus TaxID=210409 RepID=A0A5B7K715_PORTR|nr:hypothetical protein [Portunus trituberculatus]
MLHGWGKVPLSGARSPKPSSFPTGGMHTLPNRPPFTTLNARDAHSEGGCMSDTHIIIEI